MPSVGNLVNCTMSLFVRRLTGCSYLPCYDKCADPRKNELKPWYDPACYFHSEDGKFEIFTMVNGTREYTDSRSWGEKKEGNKAIKY